MKTEVPDFTYDLLAVLVVYDYSLVESPAWHSLEEEAKRLQVTFHVMIYDNSLVAQNLPVTSLTIHYRHDKTNPGVSKAYNEAYKLASQLKKNWLLLLDQDSLFPSGWMEHYNSAIKIDNLSIAVPLMISATQKIISPFNYWVCIGRSPKQILTNSISLEQWFAINSGLLISCKIFEKVGGYDEAIPLDFSDYALMHKLKKLKVKMHVLLLSAKHSLSSMENRGIKYAQVRFYTYCKGNKGFARYTGLAIFHFFVCGCRAIKFSIHYRSFTFMNIFIRTWATG